jgi:sarcosine oxidase gamma subunit
VVELRALDLAVVNVLSTPEGCDAVAARESTAIACRMAPDEVLLICGDGEGNAADTAAQDPQALVVDVTDGWTAWELRGPDVREAFSRLSELELPGAGFLQGEVARLPVKIVVEPEAITLLVPAMWGEYLRERIVVDCRAVGVTEVVSP